jgi:hypothetical protein
MRANVPAAVRVREIELTGTDRAGNAARSLKMHLVGAVDQDRLRAMVQIDAPSDLAGARYLLRDTAAPGHIPEIYMYLPAMGRVRRISGARGSFLGTDFSYDDVRQIERGFDGAERQLEGGAQFDQRAVEVLVFNPRADGPYTRVRTWVDRATCVPLRADYYEGETLRKQLIVPAAGLQRSGSGWFPGQIRMRDLAAGTATQLQVQGVSGEPELAARYFDPGTFYLRLQYSSRVRSVPSMAAS